MISKKKNILFNRKRALEKVNFSSPGFLKDFFFGHFQSSPFMRQFQNVYSPPMFVLYKCKMFKIQSLFLYFLFPYVSFRVLMSVHRFLQHLTRIAWILKSKSRTIYTSSCKQRKVLFFFRVMQIDFLISFLPSVAYSGRLESLQD